MIELITNIAKTLYPSAMFNIVATESHVEQEDMNPESVTIVYSTTIGSSKGYHFYETEAERIKYNSDIFEVCEAKEYFHESIKVALIKGTTLYLLFETNGLASKFIEAVLKAVLPELVAPAEEKRMHLFKTAFASAIDAKLKEYKRDIQQNEEHAVEKEQELFELRKKIVLDKLALQGLDGTIGQWKQKAEAEYAHLMKLVPNLYASIHLEENKLIAVSHMVRIRYDGNSYDIGEFEVSIELTNGDLTISNISHKVGEYDHPHIDNGAACLGNIGHGIIKMLAEFELFGALQVIHTFLHSYNQHSPYHKIEFWDPDYEDDENSRYESCSQDNSGYACVECGDSNCPFYENAYEVCFERSDLEDCINCEYQCSLGRGRIKESEKHENE